MDKVYLADKLSIALEKLRSWEATIEKRKECPSSEFIVRTPCYAAFFSTAESSENLKQIYLTAEKEIADIIAMKGSELPRDLNLVILMAGDKPPDPALVRKLADDRYVCRKFVLWPNGRPIDEVLAELPFWPPSDLLSGEPTSIVASVQEAIRGYDPRLIADLAGHSPGAVRVFEKIREGTYSLTNEPFAGESLQPPRLATSASRKLEAVDITDFRGIRRLRSEDMPLSGDIVFIYGPNGVGKTSIADAIEWAITGQVHRLQQAQSRSAKDGPDPIVNVFSDKGEARVACHLCNCERILRSKRGRSKELLIGSQRASNDRAVIDYVVGTKAPSRGARLRIGRLRDLFWSSHMLSQHNIRQFLEQTRPDERFDILTNMIGAEEFVRFREKVAAVLGHLNSHVRDQANKSESKKQELEDVSKRLCDRQKHLEELSQAVTSGKTPEDLASELLQGIRIYQCTIDETAVEKANIEPAERRFELIALQAETAIRAKKATTEDLLVRLKSLEQELAGYVESRKRFEILAAEIASGKNISEKTHADLQQQEKVCRDIQTRLQIFKTKQLERTRSCINLAWLNDNLAAYRQSQEALQRVQDSLSGQREELQRSEALLAEQKASLTGKRTRLQEIEQAIATKTKREQALIAFLKRLPEVQARRQEVEQLVDKERQLYSRISELKRQSVAAHGKVIEACLRLDEIQMAYNSEAARHDVLSSFLAKLAELVHSGECPLCGRRFASAEEAKDRIREHISNVPVLLKDLARRIDEAKKDSDANKVQTDSIAAGMRVLEAELEQVRLNKAAATKAVQDFLAESAFLAVMISVDDASSWQNALERALKECEASSLRLEANNLRDAINVLTSDVVQMQTMVDGLQQKLVHNEKERSRLATLIQGLETDMLQRGFEPSSLPQNDELVAELSKAQDEARTFAGSLTKIETELMAVESAISGLRKRQRKADEDVASKVNQSSQYEGACSRFVAECRANNVDPENPRENVRFLKSRASELNRALSALEEKRQMLQQIVSLSRLKGEIDGLVQAKGNVKRRVEASARDLSRLRDWVSHIESLEAEVVKRQVDVIDTHLKRLEPTTQRLYRRLSPHPIFGMLKIRVDGKTRELDIQAEASVARERLGDIEVSPPEFFSDAQMNSLAITIFLAGALRQRWSEFKTILNDDPIQQMDEMNVYAFLDLIRGLSNLRQFIIFTCSRDFYLLALEKLDCLNKSKRGTFLAYRLEGIAPAEIKVRCDTH